VPPPQSLNPGTLAASNPVVHPNSLISNFINIVLNPPTEGSEGNNPCAAWGCYPGPPDPIDFFFQDVSDIWKCHFISHLFVPGRHGPVKTGVCLYNCFPGGLAIGLEFSFPHVITLTKACPSYYSNPSNLATCPASFEAFSPGDIAFALQPDIIKDTCEGKPN
jgi:hypothetical protein